MAQEQIIFPNFLTDDSFKYRKMMIHVKKSNLVGSTESLKKASLEKSDNIEKAFSNISADSFYSNLDLKKAVENQKEIQAEFDKGISTIFSIALPLPNELTDSQAHKWEETTGIAKALANKASSITDGLGVNQILNSATDSMGLRKPLVDPSYFQTYEGSSARSFTFTFDLIPNNAPEAESILNLILALKKFSSPTTSVGNAVIVAPYFFDLEFGNPYMNALTNISGVVLANIEISYGASGQMAYVGSDGMIKHTKLTLTFNERRLMMSEMWG